MYAIVKTGGKQYRVEEGQCLLVERLPVDDGSQAVLQPLLYVDGSNVVDGDELSKVTVEARVVGHERGPRLRVVKFKPKRGYRRRTGHRQELTRIEVTSIKLGSGRASSSRLGVVQPMAAEAPEGAAAAPQAAAAPVAANAEAAAPKAEAEAAPENPTRSRARKSTEEAPAKQTRTRSKPAESESAVPGGESTRPETESTAAEEDNGA